LPEVLLSASVYIFGIAVSIYVFGSKCFAVFLPRYSGEIFLEEFFYTGALNLSLDKKKKINHN